MELIRANYPILIQVKLESPDGLTPARSLSQGIPAIQVPAEGNGILDIPSDYAWTGYPQEPGPGIHPVVEPHRPARTALELYRPDRLRGDALRSASSGSSTSTPARSSAPAMKAGLC